jgi:hypothetical protein
MANQTPNPTMEKPERMPTLTDQLLNPETRPKVVSDCVALIDDEVHHKSGLSGMLVKTGYGMAKAFKHGFVKEMVEATLNDFVAKLETFYVERGATPLTQYMVSRQEEVSEALLTVTDARSAKTKHSSLKKMYDKMRPTAKKNVEQALPRLGAMIGKYAPT